MGQTQSIDEAQQAQSFVTHDAGIIHSNDQVQEDAHKQGVERVLFWAHCLRPKSVRERKEQRGPRRAGALAQHAPGRRIDKGDARGGKQRAQHIDPPGYRANRKQGDPEATQQGKQGVASRMCKAERRRDGLQFVPVPCTHGGGECAQVDSKGQEKERQADCTILPRRVRPDQRPRTHCHDSSHEHNGLKRIGRRLEEVHGEQVERNSCRSRDASATCPRSQYAQGARDDRDGDRAGEPPRCRPHLAHQASEERPADRSRTGEDRDAGHALVRSYWSIGKRRCSFDQYT